jgi:hypothetical protein
MITTPINALNAMLCAKNIPTSAISKACRITLLILFISFVPARLSATKIAVGTYTGNGGTAQNITGLGFTPVMVLVQKVGSATAFIATSTMSGQTKVNGAGALASNYITAMASGQFTIGTNSANANTTAATYYYVAFAATAVSVGTFTGTGSTQAITIGFQPYMVWAMPASSTWPNYSQMSLKGSTSNVFKMDGTGAVDWHKEYLDAYTATTFSAHAYASTTETYHYVAFNVGSTGFYTGTAVTHTETPSSPTISNPVFLIAKDQGIAPNATSWYKTSVMSGANSYTFGGANSTTQITALTATGFTLGVSTDANASSSNTQWYAFGSADLLPVEITYFSAEKNKEQVDVSWQTASELNSSYYEIQRSSDGVHFETIATEAAAGFSNSLLNYSFVDENPLKGFNYYRLKEVDSDGRSQFSDIAVVDFYTGNTVLQLAMYPNPVEESATLNFEMPEQGKAKIEVFDALGKVVYSNETYFGEGANSIALADLAIASGNYFVRVLAQNAISETVHFAKK